MGVCRAGGGVPTPATERGLPTNRKSELYFMELHKLYQTSGSLPPDLVRHVLSRQAALWVGLGFDDTPQGAADIARLVALTWQCVLLESSRGETARAIEKTSSTIDRFVRIRGFVHLIAENPTYLTRNSHSLAVFMLNGRSDGSDVATSTNISPTRGLFRRQSMLEEVRRNVPPFLVVLCDGSPEILRDAFEVWGDNGFAGRMIVLDPFDRCGPHIESILKTISQPTAIDRCVMPLQAAITSLTTKIEAILPDDRLIVRMLRDGHTADVDLTSCDEIESPLSDRFNVILTRDLEPILPADLSDVQINQFFEGATADANDEITTNSFWAPYSAGLPWIARSDLAVRTLTALDSSLAHGYERNCIVVLPCEPGAGGTTLARSAAFAVANAGFPVLIAKDEPIQLNPSQLAGFLTRAADKARQQTKDEFIETPWLIVFDVGHWRGREGEAVTFYRQLVRSGRSVVILFVVENIPDVFRLGRKELVVAERITHNLSQQDAEALGMHLNRLFC